MKPINELVVIELASVLAGPLVGSFFAELGATILKIENPTKGGDITRSWKLANEKENDISAYYAAANFNKEVQFLDLKKAINYTQLVQLFRTADIVINNIPLESSKRLKIDFETIIEINPTIIYGLITGFGMDSNRAAFDLVLQAETGYLSMCGTKVGEKTRMPVALIDVLAAHQLKEGILVALLQKKHNQSCFVHVSLYATALASLANQASNWLMAHHIAKPMGTLHPNIAPYGETIRFKDGFELILAIGNNKQFATFCSLLDLESISQSEKYSTNPKRVVNRVELLELLQSKAYEFNGEEIYIKCLEKNIPVGKINDLKTVFEEKNAKELVQTSSIENTITKRVQSTIFELSFKNN